MNLDELRALAGLMEECGISALEVTEEGRTVKLERRETAKFRLGGLSEGKKKPAPESCRKSGNTIDAPLVGVFYAAPSPDAKPFVSVGSAVKQGDVLCLVEAMKLMNEITSDRDGVIAEICAENGQVVEFGQPLFVLR